MTAIDPTSGAANSPDKRTIVEAGTELSGAVRSSVPVEVRGVVDGELESPVLVVHDEGAVRGRCKVGDLRSTGTLRGRYEAKTASLRGRVEDDTVIVARSLDVPRTEGALSVIFGACELEIGDDPSLAPTDEPSLAPTNEPVGEAERHASAPADGSTDEETDDDAGEDDASDEQGSAPTHPGGRRKRRRGR